MSGRFRTVSVAAATIATLFASASIARAQVLIKVNDDVNFKLGVLGQVQADTLHDTRTDVTATNLFIRRVRLLFG
jgi:hypothetical protein